MRFVPSLIERASGDFIGDDYRSNGRVTVEPNWLLNSTSPTYGGSVRGPYRWWQDQADTGVQWEVPNIKSIEWDRSEDQDIASCTITLYNMSHEEHGAAPELAGQLGRPGYYWPKRGMEVNRWNQVGGKGAFRKDGVWDANFSWQNVLVPYGLIRTFEGYGGNPTESEYVSVDQNLEDENIIQTGTWLIESVSAGSGGELTLTCKDIGVLLLKELCFPPVVPDATYPLDYYPAGKSPFDSFFGAKPATGVSPASYGEVYKTYYSSSLDVATSTANASVGGHQGSHSIDGNWSTYALSEAYATPVEGTVYWEYTVNGGVSKVAVKPWAGGYECYVSVLKGGTWIGSILMLGGVNAVNMVHLGLALPDGMEPETYIEIPPSLFDSGKQYVTAERVRITLRNTLYYSGIADSGKYYRGGLREVTLLREGAKVNPYSPDFATLPWTFSMAAHPVRGYWVLDSNGTVHGFGDAADYDSSAFGNVPLSGYHANNTAIAMKGHPDGKGYWVIDVMGHVFAYGSASHYGEHVVAWPGTDKWGEDGLQAWDIAPTYTGNGYWVIYGDGTIKGFGDATPTSVNLPWTAVGIFMNTVINSRYLYQRNGNGLAGHPTKMGFWATTGSGEVYAYGAAQHYGQLVERVYNPGMADEFRLGSLEFTKSIESTASGNGYWIAFGSGHIAAFGDAINQGKTFIYDEVPNFNMDLKTIQDSQMWGFFRALVWSIARDPDGTGFWVLVADGSVGQYNAEFWGQPGYNGKTGYRWHEGNYDGDPMSIVKEFLAWSGWTFYSPSATSLEILGELESTGINSDYPIAADKFDKRPILDIIKELIEVVGYGFQVREDGGIKITSRNVWRSGNFDWDGERIYVDGNSLERVAPEHENATEFIPLIDENIDLFDYSASLTGNSMRSEIIIGTDAPDPKDPASTGFIRHTPQSAVEELKSGVPALRNIPIPAMWINGLFESEEMKIMAELIDLNAWFSSRTGSATCVAMPTLGIGDQVKFAERNTSEYNIHYVRGIKSSHDLIAGTWDYNLTTHWLGDRDNWVITANNVSAPVTGLHYFQISESVDKWQQKQGLGLGKGGQGAGWSGLSNIVQMTGAFSKASMGVEGEEDEDWVFSGTITVYKSFNNLSISLPALTAPLGTSAVFDLYDDDDDNIFNVTISNLLYNYSLPTIGVNDTRTDYTYTITGSPNVVGNGFLRATIKASGSFKASVEDTLLIVG